jgi:hypothetical protein
MARQKGFVPLLIILVIAIIVVVGYIGYKNFKPVISQTVTTSTPSVSNTPSNLFSLTIPKDSDWVKFQAQCPALKDNIEIYYPKNWYPKEFDNVTDNEPPSNAGGIYDCQVIFGYAAIPDSYQDPGPTIAEFRVETWLDTTNTNLDDYLNSQIDDSKKYDPSNVPTGPIDMTFGSQTYKALEYPESSGVTYDMLYTKKGDRFFRLDLIGSHGNSVSGTVYFDSSFQTIDNGFLNRIKIL